MPVPTLLDIFAKKGKDGESPPSLEASADEKEGVGERVKSIAFTLSPTL